MKKTIGKRLLSSVTSVLLAASYILPGSGGLSAFAADNISGSKTIDDVTLLVGTPKDGTENPLRGDDVASTIQNYKNEYALGIASQFCVFIEDYFVPHDSDAEGRVAVGGHFEVKTGLDYQVGKGDFQEGNDKGNPDANLDNLLNSEGYAHFIWGALERNNGVYDDPALEGVGWEVYGEADEKKVAFDSSKLVDGGSAKEYLESGYPNNKDNFYGTEGSLIDFDEQFKTLQTNSEKLAKMKNQFEIKSHYQTDHWGTKFDVVTVSYTGDPTKPTDTVYFNLDELSAEDRAIFNSANIVRYENIPKLETPRTVVDNNGTDTSTWEYSYIVINDSSEGEISLGHRRNSTDWATHYTTIKGYDAEAAINVSKEGDVWMEYDDEGIMHRGYPVKNLHPAGTDNGIRGENNEAGVTSLLYNFPNADQIVLVSQFQGTILAPNAHVTDAKFLKKNGTAEEKEKWKNVNEDSPHISGAVIAKSFEGNIEFGYRPFTGPISMLGADTGYVIDLSKQIAGLGELLDGAEIGLYDANTSELVTSTLTQDMGDHNVGSTPINAQLLFGTDVPDIEEFNKTVTPNDSGWETTEYSGTVPVEKTYYIQEVNPPVTYSKSNIKYYINIKETYMILEGTEDTIVPASVTIKTYPAGQTGDRKGFEGIAKGNCNLYEITYGYDTENGEIQTKTFSMTSQVNPIGLPLQTGDVKEAKMDVVLEMKDGTWTSTDIADATEVKNSLSKFENQGTTYYYDAKNATVYPQMAFPVFSSTSNDDTAVILDNAQLQVKKVNEKGNLLPGATLAIYRVPKTDDAKPVKTITTTDDAELFDVISATAVIAPNDHQLIVNQKYVLEEITAPDGYKVADPIYFYIDEDYKLNTTKYPANGYDISDGNGLRILTMKDELAFSVAKVDEDTKAYIAGAEIGVYNAEENLVEKITSSAEGAVVLKTTLKPGEYYLQEIAAPEGYILNDAKQYFYVDEDLNVVLGIPDTIEEIAVSVGTVDSDDIIDINDYIDMSQLTNNDISKIEVIVGYADPWGGIQFKTADDEYDENHALLANTTNVFTGQKLDANGKMKFTYWGANIEDIIFYFNVAKSNDTWQADSVITVEGRTLTFPNKSNGEQSTTEETTEATTETTEATTATTETTTATTETTTATTET
ncbi:MAG: choice-of-anchor A family protein, partial [Oscillospiraceae bacterium]|nr:choice-of-anchor A family protein [Oscillospiraceae bacterium]